MATKIIQEAGLGELSPKQLVETLIEEYAGGKVSAESKDRFLEWLVDDKNEKYKDEILKKVWDDLPSKDDDSVRKSLREVLQKLDMPDGEVRKLTRTPRRLMWRIAAVLVPLFVVAGYLWLGRQAVEPMPVAIWNDVCVGNGDSQTVTLPDGSVVVLNSGTVFSSPDRFDCDSVRRVSITGEGFFKVAKADKPFYVQAGEVGVRVTGTEFNVSAYGDDNEVSVALFTGGVKTEIPGHDAITLKRNQKIIYSRTDSSVSHTEADIDRELAWTRGEFNIDGKTLAEIFALCERHFGIDLEPDREPTDQVRYSTKFVENESLENVMLVLSSMTEAFDYEIDNENNKVLIIMK